MSTRLPTFQLPEVWTAPERIEDCIVADAIEIHRAGMSTVGCDGEEVCGSAAGTDPSVGDRAWFELLERVSTLEAARSTREVHELFSDRGELLGTLGHREVFPESDCPDRWRYARSNGVALHTDWRLACERAVWELAERDRVIRSWYGEISPVRLADSQLPRMLGAAKSFEWRAYAFPEPSVDHFSNGIEVVGIFGLPARPDVPFVLGLSGRSTLDAALASAATEALQMLAFLWGEVPQEETASTTPSPMQHLDRYQLPRAQRFIREWLDGEHARYWPLKVSGPRTANSQSRVGFVDLTPEWLSGAFRVVKAACSDAMPLAFGDCPFAAHLPSEIRLHPIP